MAHTMLYLEASAILFSMISASIHKIYLVRIMQMYYKKMPFTGFQWYHDLSFILLVAGLRKGKQNLLTAHVFQRTGIHPPNGEWKETPIVWETKIAI